MSLKPKVYRDIEIEGARSLYDLAEAIVGSFGFSFDHAFGYYSDLGDGYLDSPEQYELFADREDTESDAESAERTAVVQAFDAVGKKMLFLFDYGDEWHFKTELLACREKLPKTRYPRIVSKVGKAPPQYSYDEED